MARTAESPTVGPLLPGWHLGGDASPAEPDRPTKGGGAGDTADLEGPGDKTGLKERVAEYEKSLIEVALVAARGSQKRAAEALGVLPTTLHAKLRRYGLESTCRSLRLAAAEAHPGEAHPTEAEPRAERALHPSLRPHAIHRVS